MRPLALSILLLISSFCFSHEVTKTYNFNYLKEFTYIGHGNIEIKQGEKDQLTLTADPKLLDSTHISDHKGTLKIISKDEVFSRNFPGTITGTLEVKNLNRINLRGGVSIDIDKLQGNQLMINMELEGSSLIEGLLDFQRIAVIIHGNSKATFKGKVVEQIVYIKGAGMYGGESLESKTAKVNIRGPGVAFVNAADELDITMLGYGHVHYIGVPEILKKKVKGMGKITPYKEEMDR